MSIILQDQITLSTEIKEQVIKNTEDIAANTAAIEENAENIATNAENIQQNAEDIEEIRHRIVGVYTYKGQKENYSDLPTSGNELGDVWNIKNADEEHGIRAGDNVAWNEEEEWDNIAGQFVQKNADWNATTGVEQIFNKPTQLTDFENNIYPITRVRDYLYTIEFTADQVDYSQAEAAESTGIGACSGIRNGKFYGRCYDWYYDESCTFVVNTKAGQNRFASVGISASVPNLTEEFVKTGEWNESYKKVPFYLTDGINEKGLTCSINVVPTGDWGETTGTHPDLPGPSYAMTAIPRYILDHFTTADEAVYWLENEAKMHAIEYSGHVIEIHFMIADANKTYIAEVLNNVITVIDVTNKPYMTNFYISNTTTDEDGHINPESCTPHGVGLERYNLIVDMYDEANTQEGMKNLIKALRYTKMVERETNPFWYTEFCGETETFGNLTVTTPREQFTGIIDYAINMFNHRSRDRSSEYFGTWQCVHNTIYDMEKKTLNIRVQEDYDNDYWYTFPVNSYVASTGINIDSNIISAPVMTGATDEADGKVGIVPAPQSTDTEKFLRGDGTWSKAGTNASYDEENLEIVFV